MAHPLAIKFQRLSKPLLFSSSSSSGNNCNIPIIKDSDDDVSGSSFLSILTPSNYPTNTPSLCLSDDFGDIFLGQHLNCLLNINSNIALSEYSSIQLRAELQSATGKTPILHEELLLPHAPAADEFPLAPSHQLSRFISIEISELGSLVLACHLSYKLKHSLQQQPQEPLNLRKFYRFLVGNPFSVKTRIFSLFDGQGSTSTKGKEIIFIEAQLKNTSNCEYFIASVNFKPESAKTNLNSMNLDRVTRVPFQKNQIRNYTFKLETDEALDAATPLGKLEFTWNGPMGEFGHLMTGNLFRKHSQPQTQHKPQGPLPPLDKIKLIIENIPSELFLEQPFKVVFRIVGLVKPDHKHHLWITREKSEYLLQIGKTREAITSNNDSFFDFSMTFLPLIAGSLKLDGFKIFLEESEAKDKISSSENISSNANNNSSSNVIVNLPHSFDLIIHS